MKELLWVWAALSHGPQSQINLKGFRWVGHKHSSFAASRQRCYQLPLLPAVTSSPLGWTEFFQTSSQRETFPPPPQSFVRDWSQEGKGNWHRNQENVSPSQDHNNGWAGVGATERTGTEGTWYRRGKRYSRIIDKYTRLLLSPESFGGCFIVCLRQGTRIPGFHRTWFVV